MSDVTDYWKPNLKKALAENAALKAACHASAAEVLRLRLKIMDIGEALDAGNALVETAMVSDLVSEISDNRPSLKDASPEDVRIALNVPPYPDASEKQD